MSGPYGAVVWLVISIVLFVLEGFSIQLFCIWFAIGALCTTPVAFLEGSFTLQLVVFIFSSVAFLLIARPFVKKRLMKEIQPTNADRVIGLSGLVLEEINNLRQTGRVNAMGLTWTARAEDSAMVIPVQTEITVKSIDGVKLIVTPAAPNSPPPISR